MPNSEIAKIKWGRKKTILVAGGLFIIAAITCGLLLYGPKDADQRETTLTVSHSKQQKTLKLKILRTADQQAQGLSGTDTLPHNEGRLFWGDTEAQRCFWMKDMKYPLDIIWVDAHKKVTHIAANTAPKTYPKSFCATGQYVIEINAGLAQEYGIKPGIGLKF